MHPPAQRSSSAAHACGFVRELNTYIHIHILGCVQICARFLHLSDLCLFVYVCASISLCTIFAVFLAFVVFSCSFRVLPGNLIFLIIILLVASDS